MFPRDRGELRWVFPLDRSFLARRRVGVQSFSFVGDSASRFAAATEDSAWRVVWLIDMCVVSGLVNASIFVRGSVVCLCEPHVLFCGAEVGDILYPANN